MVTGHFMNIQITYSYLMTLALGICGLGVPHANAQQPAPSAQEFSQSGTVEHVDAYTDKSNAPGQVPMLLELADNVTWEKVKPGDAVHFFVVEDVIVKGLVVIAEGTTVGGKVKRLDEHIGPGKLFVLMVSLGTVGAVTGEELRIASATGNQSDDLETLTMQFEDWPGVRGFFGHTIHYLPKGARKLVVVTLPTELDRTRLQAAQPKPESPPGYATVYFIPPAESSVRTDVWCGAVEIGMNFKKVLLRPGSYSCRGERFSPQESYLDFNVDDGGTYYVVADGDSLGGRSGNLSLGITAGAVERWNKGTYPSFGSAKAADLTKVDPEMFRKLRPFVCAQPLHCADRMDGAFAAKYAIALPSLGVRVQNTPHSAQGSPTPESTASPGADTTKSNGPPTAPMVLELANEVTSKKAKPGDEVNFHVVDDVIEDGLVVVARGTTVEGRVETVVKGSGWMQDGGLIVHIRQVKTVTGEELPIECTLGRKAGKRDVKGGLAVSLSPDIGGPLMTPIILPFLPFMKGDDFVLSSGTRNRVEVTLPSTLDRARLVAAQPDPKTMPGSATVYFLAGDVWCGAVRLSLDFNAVLLPPGNYSCRVETFSQQESYLDFAVAEGGTYYVLADRSSLWSSKTSDDMRPPGLSLTTAWGAIDMWNTWMQGHPSSQTADLTKVDPEAFRQKLPPFLRVEQ